MSENKHKNTFELFSIRLIQFWSSLEHTSIHKTKRPYTSTCLQMIKYLSDLQKGTFGPGRFFDPHWIKEKKIPKNWFTHAWTYTELRNGLIQASKYSIDGYWPNNDKTFFKSLSNIIYNPRKHNSWLFTAMQNPPEPLGKSQWKNPLPETTERLMKMDIWPKGHEFDEQRLSRGLVELKEFSDNLIRDQYDKCSRYYGTLALLTKEYTDWLYRQDWIEINENIIGTKNKVFKKFIEEQEKEIGIKIKSKGWK